MNKLVTVLFILWISDCHAATGNARDGQLMAILVITLMIIIVASGYFIDFMKHMIREFRSRKLIRKKNPGQDGEFLDSLTKPVRELEGLSAY